MCKRSGRSRRPDRYEKGVNGIDQREVSYVREELN